MARGVHHQHTALAEPKFECLRRMATRPPASHGAPIATGSAADLGLDIHDAESEKRQNREEISRQAEESVDNEGGSQHDPTEY